MSPLLLLNARHVRFLMKIFIRDHLDTNFQMFLTSHSFTFLTTWCIWKKNGLIKAFSFVNEDFVRTSHFLSREKEHLLNTFSSQCLFEWYWFNSYKLFLGLKIHPKRGKNKTKQFLNEILRPKWYLFTEHKHASNAIQKKCIFSQKEYLFCYQPFFPLTTCIKDLNKLSFVMSILCISLFIDDKTVLASKKIFNCRN